MFPILALCLLSLSFFTTAPLLASSAADEITLPIEVMGEAGAINSARFTLSNTSGIDRIYLKVHRPAYRDVSTTSRKAKASYRMNKTGKWIDITNETADVFPHEKEYGGIAGSYHTIRMYLPVSDLRVGGNRIYFRFNGTDGITTGYRVLEFNLMRGNRKVLSSGSFTNEDPRKWKPFYPRQADIRAGKRLWDEGKLRESPLNSRILPVSCGDCHAQDGRDLKYFNYSDLSIVERSRFHGLSTTHGRQIASYIRSLDAPSPAMARPWNPPYQPGPGIDDLPVEEWAAGAGLDWVLEQPDEEAEYQLSSMSASALAGVVNIDKKLNVRETPVAIQLPDWNAWLPHDHPGDLMPDEFYKNARFRLIDLAVNPTSYQELYEETKKRAARVPQVITGREGAANYLEQFAIHSSHIHTGNSYAAASTSNRERKLMALTSWSAVKQWEIMHTYDLEDKASKVYGSGAEKRSWLSNRRNVFELAPHRSGSGGRFQFQNLLEGKYFSTAWYHLQLVINSGNKGGRTLAPNDWNYLPDHISGLNRAGGPRHPWRYVFSVAKMLQHYNDGEKVVDSGIGFRQIHPARHLSNVGTLFADVEPQTVALIKGQLLAATMDLIESHEISEWPRTNRPTKNNDLRPSSYKPKNLGTALNIIQQRLHDHYFEDVWISMIPIFQDQGVDCKILERAVAWGKKMWPKGDWDAAIDDNRCGGGAVRTGTGKGLRGRYFHGVQLEKFVTERIDPKIDFNWGTSSPAPGVRKNLFSVEWEGYIQPLYTGTYTFETHTDDGVRLWIDKKLLVNEWKFQAPTTHSAQINLVAGVKYPIKMRYLEHIGGAKAVLLWTSKFQPRERVPQSQLYPLPLSKSVAGKSVTSLSSEGLSLSEGPVQATPNPTSGLVRITGAEPGDEFSVYDPFGRLIQSGQLGASANNIDFSSYSPAIYTVRIGDRVIRVVRQ